MESILPMGGFQLPFQRRLSRLYNDTKKSSDFVKEPVQQEDDPEIKALYRKLRIQKDRFVSWGLEWSDPNQSAEIDESLSKAGLSEVVGSIMSTIKDILAEAEPLWLSSKRVVEGARPSADRKAPLVQWDKSRFEDLVRDLTASIDTLYDLSRTRASGSQGRQTPKPTPKAPGTDGEFKSFESTRMQTPRQIDPNTLTHLQPAQGHGSTSPSVRTVVYMSKTAYSEFTHGVSKQSWAPLLLEYANFDPIYSTTGIMPPMARFEKLSAGLQQDPQRAPSNWTGLPRLLGYFEEIERSRLGLVYLLPPTFSTISTERLTQSPQYTLLTLSDLLTHAHSEPPLEAKFRFAYNLINTVFDMHARGVTHGDLHDGNVSFSKMPSPKPDAGKDEVDIRRPLISSFGVFSEDASSTQAPIWRHPLDPRSTSTSPLPRSTDERVLDLYSLAMILLSIGLWTKLDNLTLNAPNSAIPESVLETLAVRCGTLYMKAVQACWKAVDDELSGHASGETLLSAVQMRVTRFLETCCILDGVSGLEERMEPESQPPSNVAQKGESSKGMKEIKGKKTTQSISQEPKIPPVPIVPPALIPGRDQLVQSVEHHDAITREAKTEAKVRLYPHVPLPPDIVEKWNAILMPQINLALRSFYRKHPESVEISLESVGPSPHQTRPTVLVVCSSVGKVRAILKKKLGELFDDTTGFGLKVCRGSVIRSRRQVGAVTRSMAGATRSGASKSAGDGDDVDAVNPEFQEQPGNGASIGAWIGDRHLPPVSFGGLVIIDDKPYGMTVHHMLDDPDRDFGMPDTMRSSAIPGRDWFVDSTIGSYSEEDFSYELSDTETDDYSETDLTSDYDEDEDEEEDDGEYNEPGDVPGIEPGCGEGYIVTQPALDDVEEGFYPCTETEDEDHIDTYSLGEVYASSGIRRKQAEGLIHEVDWALFEFADGRLPDDNFIPKASDDVLQRTSRKLAKCRDHAIRPTTVAPWSSLPGMEVQCMARTSGLQTGQILPALTSVKIYGRQSPSHTYQVASTPSSRAEEDAGIAIPLGIPGDSGAWLVERHNGQLCGHVLAWSQRKRVAYICSMDVLLLDIAQTLEATEVRLPGGEPIVMMERLVDAADKTQEFKPSTDDEMTEQADDNDTPPPLISALSPNSLSTPPSSAGSPKLKVATELHGIAQKIGSVSISGRRIDVNG